MEQVRPSYSTIASFINKVIVPNETAVFSMVNKQIAKELGVELDDAFIDGTKMEANANKYKFVWKPVTFHKRLSASFFEQLKKYSLCEEFRVEEMVSSKTVAAAIDALEAHKAGYSADAFASLMKTLEAFLEKVLEYEEKERICGEGRNSYYKTDHDATAMCLKEDYYSGLGSNMHAAYNFQALVIKGLVFACNVSQSRNDIGVFIPTLRHFQECYGRYPSNVCADSGYGSLENYRFLRDNGIGNYVKHQSWEGNASGSYPDCYRYDPVTDTVWCLWGKIGKPDENTDRHPKKAGGKLYRVSGCEGCPFADYCNRFTKRRIPDSKVFEVVPELQTLKGEAERNLLSPKGIEMRVNRSIQIEGFFGIEKQDRGYTRIRRRGLARVSAEYMLTALGLNIRKLYGFYAIGRLPSFWVAPADIKPQEFKKPSAKRLSKKGRRINEKLYKNKQA